MLINAEKKNTLSPVVAKLWYKKYNVLHVGVLPKKSLKRFFSTEFIS